MPAISITTSMYKTEAHLPKWISRVLAFAQEATEIELDFEINAIANDPTERELELLQQLTPYHWFHLYKVPREPIYASWNRGVSAAKADVCTSWNVDDIRNARAMRRGLKLLEQNDLKKERGIIVYFPFVYKRYINILNCDILVKRMVVNPPVFTKEEFIRSMHIGPFFLFTKSTYQKIGAFDEKYSIVGDYEWQARAASKGVHFLKSDEISGVFKNNGKTLSGSRSTKHMVELEDVLKNYKTLV